MIVAIRLSNVSNTFLFVIKDRSPPLEPHSIFNTGFGVALVATGVSPIVLISSGDGRTPIRICRNSDMRAMMRSWASGTEIDELVMANTHLYNFHKLAPILPGYSRLYTTPLNLLSPLATNNLGNIPSSLNAVQTLRIVSSSSSFCQSLRFSK